MQVEIKNLTPVKKEMLVEVPQDHLQPYFDKAYKNFQRTAKISGFRQGKVPMEIIKKMYGSEIQYREIEKIAQDFYKKAYESEDIKPVTRPIMKTIDYQPGNPLKFTIAYDVKPKIKLGNYKKRKYLQIDPAVTSEDVEKEIEYLRAQHSKLLSVTDKGLEKEDMAVLEVYETDGKNNRGTPLNNKLFRWTTEEFSDSDKKKLLGKKPGEGDILTLLEDKKKRKVEVVIKSISVVQKPEMNAEFIKSITNGQYEDVDAYKAVVKDLIEKEKRRLSNRSIEDYIVNDLIKNIKFELPETLVENYLDSMLHEEEHRQKDHKLPEDFNVYEFRLKNRTYAENSAKWYLIKQEIIEEEKLTVTEEDVNSYIDKIASEQNLSGERLRGLYNKPDMRDYLENQILNEKVFESIKENAKIDMVPAEKFKLD